MEENNIMAFGLFKEALQECVMMNRAVIDNPYGGTTETYTEGAHFKASVYLSNSLEMQRAEQEGVKGLYQITTDKSIRLRYNDVFKRLADPVNGDDEVILRITSKDDNSTPNSSTLNQRVVNAEEFILP
jgi:hypothetical protein